MPKRARCVFALTSMSIALAGCKVGPNYRRPAVEVPAAFKEASAGGVDWRPARPSDGSRKGAWWLVFGDPQLSALEQRVSIDNQNLKAALAAHDAAEAAVDETRANLLPTISLRPRISRYHLNDQFGVDGQTRTRPAFSGTITWRLDLWGEVRRQVESNQATARASAAQLAWLSLQNQADLANDYFQMRYDDSMASLLKETVSEYEHALEVAKQQHNLGAVSDVDVIAAQTQVQNAKAQLVNAGIDRAAEEHAIAVLVGVSPEALMIKPGTLAGEVPSVPVDLPSRLLERRPDVVEAEQNVVEQNAKIGTAIAAYYPDVNLGALGGYSGAGALFQAGNKLWLLTAQGSEVIFNGGARSAKIRQARANYEQSVATYRQKVLEAFQGVDDDLSSLRILRQKSDIQDMTIASALHGVRLALNEYRMGAVDYTTVTSAQTSALNAEEAGLQVRQQRLSATVSLIEALGGAWQ
ncbi:efflux transporter outer membrane subunit [Acidomonas methanolica]|uniref:efflux transporter outer membrane subunit n=1 Tax=Acidomonas methanolica TaxID=437 RepID=UPI00211A462D|nr:efflux transporter outer membrane subunit [Acidomonas methanolica]MCQ9156862.1 efflux transporter outer membrane subunit [Acidomonas methanolica]